MSKELEIYKYDHNKDSKIRFLPSISDISKMVNKTYVKDDIFIVDYPCLITDTLKLKGIDKSLYAAAIKIVNNSVYGTLKGVFHFPEPTPQEIRNEARSVMQKKLDKVRNA